VAHFTPAEVEACRQLVELALAEDLDDAGDRTSQAVIPPHLPGRAEFVARAPGVLAGLPAAEMVLSEVDPHLHWQPLLEDGSSLKPGDRIARITGHMASILAGERTALNFLQRLSGVATQTRRYADQVAGLPCQLLDTRKTTPGWRLLEKYAVRMGGGHNHRIGLFDGVLIKDNHLAALGSPGAITRAVRLARQTVGPGLSVEVDTPEQFEEALAARPDIILLDNMPPELMRKCVARRNEVTGPAVRLEASGGVTLATLRAIAETGVDRVSVGALTHSAVALDIALDYSPVEPTGSV
jgi:nicotinate-nucleotide pyrophosphorylase (carboxylating)